MFHRKKASLPVAALALLGFGWTATVFAGGQAVAGPPQERTNAVLNDTVAALEAQLRQQQAQIDKLTAALADQQRLLDSQGKSNKSVPDAGATRPKSSDPSAKPSPDAPVTEQEFQQFTTK